MRQLSAALLQHIREIFAGMPGAGKVQRDLPSFAGGDDPAGKHTGVLIAGIAFEPRHTHAGVVVVHHFALRRLPDQLVTSRFDRSRSPLDDLSLRGRRQRYAQLLFQLLQPVARSAAAILELRDHGRGRFIVLILVHAFRRLGREYLPAGAAAQPLQRVLRRGKRRPVARTNTFGSPICQARLKLALTRSRLPRCSARPCASIFSNAVCRTQ